MGAAGTAPRTSDCSNDCTSTRIGTGSGDRSRAGSNDRSSSSDYSYTGTGSCDRASTRSGTSARSQTCT